MRWMPSFVFSGAYASGSEPSVVFLKFLYPNSSREKSWTAFIHKSFEKPDLLPLVPLTGTR